MDKWGLASARVLVADEVVSVDDHPYLAGWLQRLCRAATRNLPANGVGVSLVNEEGLLITAAASSPDTFAVEELQFTLGEGPCLAAFQSRSPVLVPDLAEPEAAVWPAYSVAALEQGVRSVFAFPLQVGATRLGALDVYRDQPGSLLSGSLSRALTFAEVTMEALLSAGESIEDATHFLEDVAAAGYVVYQAQGMVMIQLGVTPQVALLRLRAHAFAEERRLSDVADDVVHRRLTLRPDKTEGLDGDDDRS